MRHIFLAILVATLSFSLTLVCAETEQFDTDKMVSDLEDKLQLSQEKLDKLKPALDAKSAELKNSINESVDKGFVELDKLSSELDAISKDAEKKAEEVLNREEMQQLKEYLGQIDKDAIREAGEMIVAELTKFLELTEAQVVKLKPLLTDSFKQLEKMLNSLAQKGTKNLEEFKNQYNKISKDLNVKVKDLLSGEQLELLNKHNGELEEKIRAALVSS